MRILMTGATGLVGQGVLHEVLARRKWPRSACSGGVRAAASIRAQDLLVASFDALEVVADRSRRGTPTLLLRRRAAAGHARSRIPPGHRRPYPRGGAPTRSAIPRSRFLYVSGALADPARRMMPLRVRGEGRNRAASLADPHGDAASRWHPARAWRAQPARVDAAAVRGGRAADGRRRAAAAGDDDQHRRARAQRCWRWRRCPIRRRWWRTPRSIASAAERRHHAPSSAARPNGFARNPTR